MPALPSLAGWEGFWVIIGSSGAALTGLMFVVVALAADRDQPQAEGVGAFGSPTVFHFEMVLLVAAIGTIPRRTVASLGLCLLATALVGLVYTIVGIARMRRQRGY